MVPAMLASLAALFAASVNFLAAHRISLDPTPSAPLWVAAFRRFVGAFAVFYAATYAWLAFSDVSVELWLVAHVWIAPLTFLGPWSLGAIAEIVYRRGRKATDESADAHADDGA